MAADVSVLPGLTVCVTATRVSSHVLIDTCDCISGGAVLWHGPVLTHSRPSQAWHDLILGLHPCRFVHICVTLWSLLDVVCAHWMQSIWKSHTCSLAHLCPAAGSQGGSEYQLPPGRSTGGSSWSQTKAESE